MSNSVLQRTSLAERLSRGFLSTQRNSFAISLKERRYAKSTIYLYARECDIFCDWLTRKSVSTEELNGNAVNRYLSTASSYTKSTRTGNPRPQTRPAIMYFVRHLRDIGYLSIPLANSAPVSDVQRWLDCYQKYLADVRGLATDTQKQYLLYASRFLARQPRINWSQLSPSDIFDFVSDKKTLGRGRSPQKAAAFIRPFLLYLVSCGEIPIGLTNIIPGRKRRSQSIPQGLSECELKHLLLVSKDDTPIGTRNYAILMLLARLGLRGCEVRALRLGDVDWRNGTLLIRAGKTHRERSLPLPRDAAKAILRYLQLAVLKQTPVKFLFSRTHHLNHFAILQQLLTSSKGYLRRPELSAFVRVRTYCDIH